MNSYKYSRVGVDRASSFDVPIEVGGYVHLIICVAAACALILAGNCKSAVAEAAADVDAARMTGADRDPANWMTYGRTYSDAAKGILGCSNCHGPNGEGMPPMPYLAGQYAQYITFTLRMWKNGFRKNSPDLMDPIAEQLDDQESAAVAAAYYQQVRRPGGAAASK